MIGMSCTGESAEVNFGEKEFIFNFNAVREVSYSPHNNRIVHFAHLFKIWPTFQNKISIAGSFLALTYLVLITFG